MNVRNNPFFRKAEAQARKIINNPSKVKEALEKALKKSKVIDGTKDKVAELKRNVATLIAMLKAHFTGQYKNIPTNTLVKLLAAIVYFIWFADLIPDFIAVIGLLDDAAVIAWVITSIKDDLDAFETWRKDSKKENDLTELPE